MSTRNGRLIAVLIGLALAVGVTSFAAAEGGNSLGSRQPSVLTQQSAAPAGTKQVSPGGQ